MAKVTKKQLEAVVNDLNKVLKLNPSIEKVDEAQMTADIKEIEELLRAGDIVKLDKKSKKIMETLGVKLPEVEKAKSAIKTKPAIKEKPEAKAKPAAKTKPAKAKETKEVKKKEPKGLSAYEHVKSSMAGIIDAALTKGVTLETICETLKESHDRDEKKSGSKFKSHMRHLTNMHGVEINYSEKTSIYRIKKQS